MGACFDRLRCEVFQNLFLSPMNTGFVRPAVATVLTVYGIETGKSYISILLFVSIWVATVLTVYGIETFRTLNFLNLASELQQYLPFTVLKLTIAGRRSYEVHIVRCNSTYRLRY